MKYLIYGINIFLIIMIPISLLSIDKHKVEVDLNTLSIPSNYIGQKGNGVLDNNINNKVVAVAAVDYMEKNNKTSKDYAASIIKSVNYAEGIVSDVLERQVGKMSAYGPDCAGCSGRVGGGQNVLNGNIYHEDATYGKVRIVAGDRKYPYGTIVRIVNSKAGTFNAIVLDRGGDIGLGRRFTFDLLFPSEAEASKFGTSNNCTFEILRYGY